MLSRARLAHILWQLLILLGLRLPIPLNTDQAEQMRLVFDGKAFSPSTGLLADLTFYAFHPTMLDRQPANGDVTSPKVEGAAEHKYNECELCKDMQVGHSCCLAELHMCSIWACTPAAVERATHGLPGFERGRSTCNRTGFVLLVALYASRLSTTWLQQYVLEAVCSAALHFFRTSGLVWPQTGQ